MEEYYFINFLDVETKPTDGEIYVALGGLGFLFIDSAKMERNEIANIDTNVYKTRAEALQALHLIQSALMKKDNS